MCVNTLDVSQIYNFSPASAALFWPANFSNNRKVLYTKTRNPYIHRRAKWTTNDLRQIAWHFRRRKVASPTPLHRDKTNYNNTLYIPQNRAALKKSKLVQKFAVFHGNSKSKEKRRKAQQAISPIFCFPISTYSKKKCPSALFYGRTFNSFTRIQIYNCLVQYYLKGSVSRQVRHRLLYIIQKLFVKTIVRGPFLLIFIEGIRRNLRLKISAFSELFQSKGQVPLKNVGFTLSDVP